MLSGLVVAGPGRLLEGDTCHIRVGGFGRSAPVLAFCLGTLGDSVRIGSI